MRGGDGDDGAAARLNFSHAIVQDSDAFADGNLADGGIESDAVDVESAQLDVEGWLAEPFSGNIVRG